MRTSLSAELEPSDRVVDLRRSLALVTVSASAVVAAAAGAAMAIRLGDGFRVVGFAAGAMALAGVLALVLPWGLSRAPRVMGLVLVVACLAVRLAPALTGSLRSGQLPVPLLGSLQVGELTRPLMVLGLAVLVGPVATMRTDPTVPSRIYRGLILLGASLAALMCGLLAAVGDLGPAVICAWGAWIVMARSHRIRAWVVGPLIVAAFVIALVVMHPPAYVAVRFGDTLFAETTPSAQAHLARAVLGSSGLLGGGFGSNALVPLVPVARSDYVVVSFIGDLGVLLTVLILVVWMSALAVAANVLRNRPGALPTAAAALTGMLALQTVWMVLGPLGLLPVTGLPLPLLAATGSALMSSGLMIGIVVAALVITPGRTRRTSHFDLVATTTRWCVPLVVGGVLTASMVAFLRPANMPTLGVPRGDIITSDGVVVAHTPAGTTRRTYPHGPLFGSAGWMTPTGSYGLERVMGSDLTCGGGYPWWRKSMSLVVATPCRPADVVTTLRYDISSAALDGVQSYPDATVVVMDATSGAVVADVSTGRPDPGTAWDAPEGAAAVDGVYAAPSRIEATAPGSVFKLIVATAAVQQGILSTPDIGAAFEVGAGDYIHNIWNGPCPDTTVAAMIAYSCNTTAAFLGSTVGPGTLQDLANTVFGFDQATLAELTATPSTTGLTSSSTPAETARASFGQQDVRVTPLALTQAIAQLVQPSTRPAATYVTGTCDSGEFLPAPVPQPIGAGLDPQVAATVMGYMRQTVTEGTARRIGGAFPGADLAAKTSSVDVVRDGVVGTDSWITVVVDSRWIVTLVVRSSPTLIDPAESGSATDAVLPIVRQLLGPLAASTPRCPIE